MLGRSAYHDPLLVGRLDRLLLGADAPMSVEEILESYAAYIDRERGRGTPLTAMSRHLVGLIAHRPGARRWRQRLSELNADDPGIDALVALLAGMPGGSRYNAGILAPAAVRQSIQVNE
jgi:tRNA-dihydrouridine synthase A